MAITTWGGEGDKRFAKDSTRKYRIIESVVGLEETGDYYTRDLTVRLNLFIDVETGIVTADPKAFEEWLAGT